MSTLPTPATSIRTPVLVAQMIVRATGLAQIVLGLVFWTGHAHRFVPVHIALGVLLVAALWIVAGLALSARVSVPLAVVALVWGAGLSVFGLDQDQILQGSAHWVIQVLHLAVGLAAIGLAERVGAAARAVA